MSKGFDIWLENQESSKYIGNFQTYEEAARYLTQLEAVFECASVWGET